MGLMSAKPAMHTRDSIQVYKLKHDINNHVWRRTIWIKGSKVKTVGDSAEFEHLLGSVKEIIYLAEKLML
ncbi:hypothetical protein GALMADRAFT_238685 [Galerina marginata CBS 339.88]|uniref:Uncharacterized protein n=1 Tax=Galerina marginata (strain CBS 339.88) TaxID=685588 RepID=A0A067TKZ1_GALM3|nr:hypothetical protein GALMADRAFT_238685 [Galerina marginata CBS 339.88]